MKKNTIQKTILKNAFDFLLLVFLKITFYVLLFIIDIDKN